MIEEQVTKEDEESHLMKSSIKSEYSEGLKINRGSVRNDKIGQKSNTQ